MTSNGDVFFEVGDSWGSFTLFPPDVDGYHFVAIGDGVTTVTILNDD